MSISTLTESESISYEPSIICGDCGNFASAHHDNYPDNAKRPKWVCFRDQYEVGDRYATRVTDGENFDTFDTLDGLPITITSGPNPWATYDRWATEPEINDGYDQHYDDLDSETYTKQEGFNKYNEPVYVTYTRPIEVTPTLDQYRQGQRVNVSDRNGSAFVENQDGYIVVEVFDPVLTEKYQLRLLNAYKSNGKQRVGSLEIVRENFTVTITCVKCKDVMVINLGSPELTRGLMEQITLDVIRHGNNHAARWFTTRPEFYKVHEQHCDLNNCDVTKAGCSNEVTELHIKQLKEHFERVAS